MSGCTNTWRILDGWRQEECEEHGFLKGSGYCVCPQPFYLYPFPDRKNVERRQAWARNIRGKSSKLSIFTMSYKCSFSSNLIMLMNLWKPKNFSLEVHIHETPETILLSGDPYGENFSFLEWSLIAILSCILNNSNQTIFWCSYYSSFISKTIFV